MWEENTPRKTQAVGTENPIHKVTLVGFEPGFLEVEGEAKYHYANLNALV